MRCNTIGFVRFHPEDGLHKCVLNNTPHLDFEGWWERDVTVF